MFDWKGIEGHHGFVAKNLSGKAIAGLHFLRAVDEARKVDRVSTRRLTAHSAASAIYIIASEILMANLTPSNTPMSQDALITLKVFLHAALLMTDCYAAYRMKSLDSDYESIA